ncbi:MAG: site-2 protease family protein [Candidatus Sumerlaeota bacterium]|nr:site-2 protease family protein [Candidatus Sumerlaeota bacterium]
MSFHIEPIGILAIPVFLFSLVAHEYAHAWTAMKAGDLTAAYQGRLSFNPLVHLDPIGTMMILLGALTGLPLIGWARPVPVNTLRFRSARWLTWVSLAGPASNLALALEAGLLYRISTMTGVPPASGSDAPITPEAIYYTILLLFVFSNLCLCVFNLIPIPPLDGSKIFFQLFIHERNWLFRVFGFLEQYGFLILVVLFIGSPLASVFQRAVLWAAAAITGESFG